MVDAVMALITDAIAQTARRPVIIGLCGSQGSGKTTLAGAVLDACTQRGLRAATLSIDDIYLTQESRRDLARDVHPLLATRGVPGTHDVALGMAVIAALERGEAGPLPRFDKARDDRTALQDWQQAPASCEVLVFEGWCLGAIAQDPAALVEPINDLERDEDPQGTWRTYANTALAGDYVPLFARIDRLAMIAAPGFEVVHGWRLQQEEDLAGKTPDGSRLMDAPAIARFIAHYERLTRHILSEMPGRADLVIRIDGRRQVLTITHRP